MKYKRILLKLSGEQFGGGKSTGIDSKFVNDLAKELKELVTETGIELAIVVGGGNFVRGKDMKINGLTEETAHYMGMVSTMLNGLALSDVLKAHGQAAYLQSKLNVASVADDFDAEKAHLHMTAGEILIILGGTGKPFVTTDTGAVIAAARLGCDVVLKATKVDGVYDKDPMVHSSAKKYSSLTLAEALEHPEIKVMDKEALALAIDGQLTIIVFELKPGNLKKAVLGEKIGTIVR